MGLAQTRTTAMAMGVAVTDSILVRREDINRRALRRRRVGM